MPSTRQQWLVVGQMVLLAIVAVVGVLSSEAADWRPFSLLVTLFAFALVGEFVTVRAGSVHIAPAYLAPGLAWSLLGPAPAAVIAVAAVSAWSAYNRRAPELFLNNVAAYATCSVAGGLLVELFHGPVTASEREVIALVVVFAVFLAMNFLNFVIIVGNRCVLDGTSFAGALRRLYRPTIPWQVTTALVVAGTVVAYEEIGLVAIGLLVILLLTQGSLIGAVVTAEQQRDELRDLVTELVALQAGVVRVLVETLSLRDQMTARHSAAVARFARATAMALGMSERDQELVRIAGLLHDVGKFTFPDHALNSRVLSDEDWALIRLHPERGADIVRRVRGYSDVADIILAHHERVDGGGYPRGLTRDEIPRLARIISVADTFDVMTARDSYRTPVSVEDALLELRRVAGAQLDPEIVEAFVGVMEGGTVGFVHVDDADLEEELMYERRTIGAVAKRRFRRRAAQTAH